MSYEKTTWETGDTITATKLNHIEDGIAGAGGEVLVIGLIHDEQTDTTTLDKTWQQIHDATFAIIVGDNPMMGKIHEYVSVVGQMGANYSVTTGFITNDDTIASSVYVCNSADGYPVLHTD